jgi:hypothetical protein
MGNSDVKTFEQMDTPKLVFYEHSFEDPIKTSLAKSVLNLGIECRALAEENTRLKAEVEGLKEGNECLDQMHEKEMARSAFLCEEVNRTTAWGRGVESDLSWARAELLMVKAEVEVLKGRVNYWKIEAECDHGRWLRCLEDLEHLRNLK